MTTYRVTVSFPVSDDEPDLPVPQVVELRREFGALILTDVDRVEQCFARGSWAGYLATPEPLDAREVRRVAQLGGPIPTPASVFAARRMP